MVKRKMPTNHKRTNTCPCVSNRCSKLKGALHNTIKKTVHITNTHAYTHVYTPVLAAAAARLVQCDPAHTAIPTYERRGWPSRCGRGAPRAAQAEAGKDSEGTRGRGRGCGVTAGGRGYVACLAGVSEGCVVADSVGVGVCWCWEGGSGLDAPEWKGTQGAVWEEGGVSAGRGNQQEGCCSNWFEGGSGGGGGGGEGLSGGGGVEWVNWGTLVRGMADKK